MICVAANREAVVRQPRIAFALAEAPNRCRRVAARRQRGGPDDAPGRLGLAQLHRGLRLAGADDVGGAVLPVAVRAPAGRAVVALGVEPQPHEGRRRVAQAGGHGDRAAVGDGAGVHAQRQRPCGAGDALAGQAPIRVPGGRDQPEADLVELARDGGDAVGAVPGRNGGAFGGVLFAAEQDAVFGCPRTGLVARRVGVGVLQPPADDGARRDVVRRAPGDLQPAVAPPDQHVGRRSGPGRAARAGGHDAQADRAADGERQRRRGGPGGNVVLTEGG